MLGRSAQKGRCRQQVPEGHSKVEHQSHHGEQLPDGRRAGLERLRVCLLRVHSGLPVRHRGPGDFVNRAPGQRLSLSQSVLGLCAVAQGRVARRKRFDCGSADAGRLLARDAHHRSGGERHAQKDQLYGWNVDQCENLQTAEASCGEVRSRAHSPAG
uniref:(northern house mosquito) hypothetical protein n=2 Tax=Culex pipiens TaxID=7175 RepID=A0A8D8FU91_CULPI